MRSLAVFASLCCFLVAPHFIFAAVVVNEIAWMGSPPKSGETATQAANNEWMEFFNDGTSAVDLTGWRLDAADGAPAIALSGSVPGGGFFLLERTDDETVPGIAADLIYTGALSNGGETLTLKDAVGNAVHTVGASGGWPAGDNGTKDTMQRSGSGWITASPTPRTQNSASATPPPPAPAGSPPPPPAGAPTPPPAIPPSPGASGGAVAPKSSLGADAGADATAMAGTIVTFRGVAYGLNGEALDAARFLWNFGDGSTQDGKALNHIYQCPGQYRGNLSVSSGGYAGSDWLIVTVVPPRLVVSEAVPGKDGFVEIYNGAEQPVDIGGILLGDGSRTVFGVPAQTVLAAKSVLVIPNSISRLDPTASLSLGDARGVILDAAAFASRPPAGGSWERVGEGFAIRSAPTPGQYASTPSESQSASVQGTPARNPVPPPTAPKAEEQPPVDAGVPPSPAAEAVQSSVTAAAAVNLTPRMFLAAGILLSAVAAVALVFLKRILP